MFESNRINSGNTQTYRETHRAFPADGSHSDWFLEKMPAFTLSRANLGRESYKATPTLSTLVLDEGPPDDKITSRISITGSHSQSPLSLQ